MHPVPSIAVARSGPESVQDVTPADDQIGLAAATLRRVPRAATVGLMQVAALYDIHGNLPALDAVLADVARAAPDAVVIGGDVSGGPMPADVLDRLTTLIVPVYWVRGNGDREMVSAYDAGSDPPAGGTPDLTEWAARALERRHRDLLASFPPTVVLDIDGLGPTCFCHGTPESDEGLLTRDTPDAELLAALAGGPERTVVGGHVHQRFDRRAGDRRMVNPGSVGLPYEGTAGAFWALFGPDVELQRTDYDVASAVIAMRATGCPGFDDLFGPSLIAPVSPEGVTAFFEDERRAGS